MKKIYRLGEDFFIALAFVSFLIGAVIKLMEIFRVILGMRADLIFVFTVICLLFSIALSLYELTQRK